MQRAETSSWVRYTWVRRWGSVLQSKDPRYGFGSVLGLGGRNQFLDPLHLGSALGLCAAV
ncbi:hypothetical protein [Lentimonas sp. CC4]|uniref:hypothetical protein n=1 Tax=Lentimonas sp. CC4 TaxID=2676099 RepID=UPI001389BD82|nr:hypothetical protein [Lentimonas sp. CC4]